MNETTLTALLAERDWLAHLARRLVTDAAAADDLIQETWLRALQSPPERLDHPRGWLATVLRSVRAQRARGEARRARREEAAARPEAQDDVTLALERAELELRAAEAVDALPDDLRRALVLGHREGWSAARIARELGITESAVRSRQQRARERLRERLDAHFGHDRRAWAVALIPLARRAEPAPAAGLSPALVGAAVAAASAALAVAVALGGGPGSATGPTPAAPGPVAELGGSALGPDPTGAPNADPARRTPAGPVAAAEREIAFRGRLVDVAGAPLAARRLVLAVPRGGRRRLVTDADGRYQATLTAPLDAGSVWIELDDVRLEERSERRDFTAPEGQATAPVDLGTLRLERRGALRLALAERSEGPLWTALTEPDGVAASGPLRRPRTVATPRSPEDGALLLGGLDPGEHRLWWRGTGERWQDARVTVERDAVVDVEGDAPLPAASSERAVLVLSGPDGAALANDSVEVRLRGEGWFAAERHRTDADGRIELLVDALPADVALTPERFDTAAARVELRQAGEVPTPVALAPFRWLEVEVRNADGTPRDDANLWVVTRTLDQEQARGGAYLGDESWQHGFAVDGPGRYRVRPHARPFLLRVSVRPPDAPHLNYYVVAAEIPVDAPERLEGPLRVHLPAEIGAPARVEYPDAAATTTVELHGRLAHPGGAAPEGAVVLLIDRGRVLDAVRPDASGAFLLQGEAGDGARVGVLPAAPPAGTEASAAHAWLADDPRYGFALPTDARGTSEAERWTVPLPRPARLVVRTDPGSDRQATLVRSFLTSSTGSAPFLDLRPLVPDAAGRLELEFDVLDAAELRLAPIDGAGPALTLPLEIGPGDVLDVDLAPTLAERRIRFPRGLAPDERLQWIATDADGWQCEGTVVGPLAAGHEEPLGRVPAARVRLARVRVAAEPGTRTLTVLAEAEWGPTAATAVEAP
jgi:RNA polymerase sigma factor (sigma-70 family)